MFTLLQDIFPISSTTTLSRVNVSLFFKNTGVTNRDEIYDRVSLDLFIIKGNLIFHNITFIKNNTSKKRILNSGEASLGA